MTDLHLNSSAETLYDKVTAPKLISAVILILAFLFGLIMNCLYIWVLRFRMPQSVSTTWFLHLIITNLIFTFDMPFLAAYVLQHPRWTFGSIMCKFNNVLVEVCSYAAVFFLTAISLERFLLVFHPVWCRKHLNARCASVICLFLWGLAFLCSSPYLVLCNLEHVKNVTVCCSEFTISWREGPSQKLGHTFRWSLFLFHLSLCFLIPFSVIALCHLQIACKIKQDRLTKSSKPYKLIGVVIISFFVCWTPYHIRDAMNVEKDKFGEEVLQALIVLSTCFTCINCCFTPLLYLFIVDSFNKEFKKAIQLFCPF
ncbi:probable G-protein coupled receptor 33 [Hyperolius riggenbachi]|uniref:probable G-protein coupled receptor 33 n=1 Tax=Hyperolius riggenbachi TaxID=752182 RepID=UPI0035A3A397